ncbi:MULTISPECIES: hypothetical protein [Shewanella]|nr:MULTISPECIES: hypothetical protein [Shewanella]
MVLAAFIQSKLGQMKLDEIKLKSCTLLESAANKDKLMKVAIFHDSNEYK